MTFIVRAMAARDRAAWARMRGALWPDEGLQAHDEAIEEILRSADAWGFVAETPDGTAVGFAELALRKYANGCDARPVPFLEGIWVEAPFRRQGIGARLMEHIAAFAAAGGFHEIGSDTPIDNRAAQVAHLAWGFSETERVVYFRKLLKAAAR
jgi:aminoglycoside 6'-N-acetyltransferase I